MFLKPQRTRDGGYSLTLDLKIVRLQLAIQRPPAERKDPHDCPPSEKTAPHAREVLEALPLFVATFDREGRMSYINPAGRELLDLDEAELEDAILSDYYSEPTTELFLREALPAAVMRGAWHGIVELRRRDGRRMQTEHHLVAHRTKLGETTAFTVLARPLSEEAAERERAARLESHHRNQLETVGAFAAALIHDIRNLLTPLSAYAELALSHADGGRLEGYLKNISKASDVAQSMVGRFANLSRPARGIQEEVQLRDVVTDVADWLAASHPRLRIHTNVPGSVTRLLTDPVGMYQLVMNLCLNAAEAIDKGGEIHLSLEEVHIITMPSKRRSVPDGDYLRLTVADTGRGMDEATIARIFEPFYSTKQRSSGLGMTISQDIVRRHGGSLTVDSRPGDGSRFVVHLPAPRPPHRRETG